MCDNKDLQQKIHFIENQIINKKAN